MSSQSAPKPVRSSHLITLVLLVAFFAQCAWFVASVPLTQLEVDQILRGVALFRHVPLTTEPVSSPLVPLLSVAGILFRLPQSPVLLDQFWLDQHRWFIRAPFLLAGLCLALSLCYVARRLYGYAAGHIVLALFAFSPGIVACSSLAGPQIIAAWGAFGLIFTAIATSHTLYAPRAAILWNWKRITLLGIAITFAVGAQWPLVWLLVPAAAFMLWAVPHRRFASLLILFAAIIIALVLLDFCYLAGVRALAARPGPCRMARLRASVSLAASARAHPRSVSSLTRLPARCSPFSRPCRLVRSRRIRFFGNTAPLIVFVLLLAMGIFLPENGAGVILFATSPVPAAVHRGSLRRPGREQAPGACARRHLCHHCSPGCLQRRQPGAHVFTPSRLLGRWFCPAAGQGSPVLEAFFQATLRCSPLPPLPSAKVR